MYLFKIFRSFLPVHNPIGFGASDFVVFAIALLTIGLLIAVPFLAPYFHRVSERTWPSIGLLFGFAILLRLSLLPQSPAPIPSGADDFSYLLLGDTLSHWRLANATHPLHQFFEAVFILQQPAYASIYPLGQGLFLAFGNLFFHSPWAGVLLSTGLFCALCYWMLRGWLAPVWALVGGLLAVIQFGPLCPWVNSYWGGAVSATAGCLVFGSLPRLCKSPGILYGLVLGAGIGLQILTRPFEATFLALAAVAYLLFGFRTNRSSAWRSLLAADAFILASLGLTLLQNKAVTHSWTTMPYMLSRYQYGVPATFTFQPNPTPHVPMTSEQELDYRAQSTIHGAGTDTPSAYLSRLGYRFRFLRFFLLSPLYFAFLAFIPALRNWRYTWALAVVLLFALGTNFYPYFYPQYIAAVTCLFVLIVIEGLQTLSPAVSKYVAIACATSFAFWFGIYASGNKDLLAISDYQSWYYLNRGDPQGRTVIAEKLSHAPGQQLVFVRYSAFHQFEEWIHNTADIDSAQTVWANDLGTEENQKLLRYYSNRTAWLLEPDVHPPALAPYSTESPLFLTVH